MGTSDITITELKATPGIGHILLKVTVVDPRDGALPAVALDVAEFYAATTNDRGPDSALLATKIDEGKDKAAHMALTEGQTWFYWSRTRNRVGNYGPWFPTSQTGGVQATVGFAATAGYALINGYLTATVAGNALTIAVKTLSGDDPSANNPVSVAFRSSTLSSGQLTIRQITSALSLVISSGSSLGTSNATPFRVWVVLFDDAGTLRLGAKVCLSSTFIIFALPSFGVASSTAEGGAGGADSSGTVYSGSAVSAKRFRIAGYLEWISGLATAGAWSSAPDIIHLFGPGTRTPGELIQIYANADSSYNALTSNIPFDNTQPLSSEGNAWGTLQLAPTSEANLLENELCAHVSRSNAGPLVATFMNSPGDALQTFVQSTHAADMPVTINGKMLRRALTTSIIVTYVRMGATGGATMYWNGISTGALFGSAPLASYHHFKEIMV